MSWVFNPFTGNLDFSGGSSVTYPISPDLGGTGIDNGNNTLTIPATGVAALLATENVFTVQQMIDGTADQIQLIVQGHSTQTSNLLTLEKSTGTDVFTVENTGRTTIVTTGITTNTDSLYITGTFLPAAGGNYSMLNIMGSATRTSGDVTLIGASYLVTGITGTTFLIAHNNTVNVVSGTTGDAIGVSAVVSTNTGTITRFYGFKAGSTANVTSSIVAGTVTNAYGFYCNPVTGAGTGNFAIYTNAGLVRLGDAATIIPTSANTATGVNILTLSAQSSGTPAAGFGANQLFEAETATTGTSQQQAQISSLWTDATNATRKAKLQLSAYDTAQRIGIEIEASGTAPMLGFFGATPVVKPSAYTPTNVSADRSYDANATTVDELADVLGTLISDLQGLGLIA